MKDLFNKLNIVIALSIIGTALSAYALMHDGNKNFAYVRTGDLINEFTGMKEARAAYQTKSKSWSSNMDTLGFNFQKALNKFNMESTAMTPEERKKQETNLITQQRMLKDYENEMNRTAKLEEEQMTSGVLNQINSYIDKYGKDNGYDLIFGTNTSGNLLYGNQGMDITTEILQGLNMSYNQNGSINSNDEATKK